MFLLHREAENSNNEVKSRREERVDRTQQPSCKYFAKETGA